MDFLITAGATREYIDPVRFISNASSGRMGYCLAQSAFDKGHKVTLVSGSYLQPPVGIDFVGVESADEMFRAVKKFFKRCDCLIMAAAVADYTPVETSETKLKKSGKKLTIELRATTDILEWAGQNKNKSQLLVGFALEDKDIRRNAEKKLKEKKLDMIIANTPSAIGAEKATFHILVKRFNWSVMEDISKVELSRRIIKIVEDM